MGITKTDGFSEQVNSMAEIMKAMGHPARLSIMQYLSEQNSCICNDIVDELPLAQPTISRHLAELKKVGLIKGATSGKNICYCINKVIWATVVAQINELSKAMNDSEDCC